MKAFLASFFLLFSPFAVDAKEEAPSTIVIFGATGDLTSRKILPALESLKEQGHLSEETAIVGVGRRPPEVVAKQLDPSRISYVQIDFEAGEGYEKLRPFVENKSHLYYLATQPSHFPLIVEQLHQNNLLSEQSKVIIEKPFGRNLASALELQNHLSQFLKEDQIYRIDHYLGKEGVQNLFRFRFEDEQFEPYWNRDHIDSVEITLSETLGVGSRGKFWEETGLIRDIFQNHLMQLLVLTTMEKPTSSFHEEKLKLLNAIRLENIIRGQYESYRTEISPTSNVETFATGTFWIDNERWSGVPFTLRAGKKLPEQIVEIAVHFKKGDTLLIRIQPNPIISLNSTPIFSSPPAPEAYETLLLHSLHGNRTLFVTVEEHLAAWRLLDPILDSPEPVFIYPDHTPIK